MFAKSTILVAVFAVASQLVSAQVPACLIAAVNTNDNPSDQKTICGKASYMNDALNSACGQNAATAKQAFNSICKRAGVTVSLSGGPSSSTTGKTDSSSSTSSTGSASSTTAASSTMSAVTYTSQIYNSSCSCSTITTLTSSTYVGVSSVTSSGASAMGSTSATTTGTRSGSSTGTATATTAGASATVNAAASRGSLAGLSLGALAVAGLAIGL